MSLPLSVLDMHRLIEQDVQKMGFFAYQDLTSEEIDLQINRQIGFIVNGILDKHFGRELKINEQQGFQKNQVTLDNLRKIHVPKSVVSLFTPLGSEPHSIAFDLPSNYYHHIKTVATLSYECYEDGKKETKTKVVDVRIGQSQYDLANNPFHKTGLDSPIGEIVGNSMYIYKDSTFNIASAKINYIKKPATVLYAKDINGNYDEANSVHCDLDDSLHYMLVNMTSLKIQEILESPQQKVVNSQREIA